MSLADRWNSAAERLGDWCNPILVKEVRQAFKGKLFVSTFATLLLLAWCISIFGVLAAGDRIDEEPTPSLLLFYVGALQAAVLLVVPFVGYRAMQSEFDEGTWELLGITLLTPRQIVMGKVRTLLALGVVFGSVIVPCVTFCSLLPGFDWLHLSFILALTGLQMLQSCCMALALASLARKRHWQVIGMLATLLIAGWQGWSVFATSTAVLTSSDISLLSLWYEITGNPFAGHVYASAFTPTTGFLASMLLGRAFTALPVSYLLTEIAVSQVTFEADSRSGRIRLTCSFLFLEQLALLLWQHFEVHPGGDNDMAAWIAMSWLVFVITACLEPETISTRIRRKTTWRSRLISPFLPGGSRALVFLLLHMAAVPMAALFVESLGYAFHPGRQLSLLAAYIACYATFSVAACRALLAIRPHVSRSWIRIGVVVVIVLSLLPGFYVDAAFHDLRSFFFPLILLNPFSYAGLFGWSIEWAALSPVVLVALIGVHLNWHIIKRSVLDVGPVAPEMLLVDFAEAK